MTQGDRQFFIFAAGAFLGAMAVMAVMVTAGLRRPIVNWNAYCVAKGGTVDQIEGITYCKGL